MQIPKKLEESLIQFAFLRFSGDKKFESGIETYQKDYDQANLLRDYVIEEVLPLLSLLAESGILSVSCENPFVLKKRFKNVVLSITRVYTNGDIGFETGDYESYSEHMTKEGQPNQKGLNFEQYIKEVYRYTQENQKPKFTVWLEREKENLNKKFQEYTRSWENFRKGTKI